MMTPGFAAAEMSTKATASPHPDPNGIDKSALTLPEPRRIRDREHLKSVMRNSCLVCGRTPSMLIICASHKSARSVARSATSSPFRSAAAIIASSIVGATGCVVDETGSRSVRRCPHSLAGVASTAGGNEEYRYRTTCFVTFRTQRVDPHCRPRYVPLRRTSTE